MKRTQLYKSQKIQGSKDNTCLSDLNHLKEHSIMCHTCQTNTHQFRVLGFSRLTLTSDQVNPHEKLSNCEKFSLHVHDSKYHCNLVCSSISSNS